jgi:hypothetical protein
MAHNRLEPGVMVRICFHQPGKTLSLDDIGSSCLSHVGGDGFKKLKLSLLNFKREVEILDTREAAHQMAGVNHDSLSNICYHGF